VAQCGGGLRAHRYRTGSGYDNPSVYCADLKELIESMRREPDTFTGGEILGSGPELDALVDDLSDGPGSVRTSRYLMEIRSEYLRALLIHRLGDPSAPTAEAWEVIRRLDEVAPAAVAEVLRHPWIRLWVLEKLDSNPHYLAGLAGAAAIRADVPVELRLPVADGLVHLPGLGAVAVDSGATGATLAVAPGRFTVRCDGTRVDVAPDHAPAAWLPARRGGPDDWRVVLDDLDPLRDCHDWPVTGRLDAAAAVAWDGHLRAAWSVLEREAPDYLGHLRATVHSVVPLRDGPEGQPRSATHREAYGAVALAAAGPDSTAELLVHEMQHVRLGAVLDACTLFDLDSLAVVTVPWRPDPRPVEGALQGLFAHHALVDLWRRHSGADAPARADRYRERVTRGAAALLASGALTAAGTRFVTRMAAAADADRPES
jgi:uncharacterized protein